MQFYRCVFNLTLLSDTGSHFYDAYETSDGKYISLGSIEPQFYDLLLKLAGIPDDGAMSTKNRMKRKDCKVIQSQSHVACHTMVYISWMWRI